MQAPTKLAKVKKMIIKKLFSWTKTTMKVSTKQRIQLLAQFSKMAIAVRLPPNSPRLNS